LALAAIWANTALSVEIAAPKICEHIWRFGVGDFIMNVVLYLALGVALRRYGCVRCGLLAAGVSIAVETVQLFYPDRVTAGWDVVANVAGAVTGCWFAARLTSNDVWGLDPFRLNRRTGVFAAAVAAVALFLLGLPPRPPDFSNWDPECRLTLRDELGRDRPWDGDIDAFVVLSSCLGSKSIERLAGKSVSDAFESSASVPSVVYASTLADETVPERGVPLLGGQRREAFYRELVESGRLSLLVWFKTNGEDQSGPARIISFSKRPVEQNFAIGQEKKKIIFRLRTGTTVPGGYFPQTTTEEFLRAGVPTFVAATYDGRNTRVYVDGRYDARKNLHARGRLAPFLSDGGLPAAAALVGVLMSMATIGAMGPLVLSRRWLVGAFGGAVGGVMFVVAGGVSSLPEFIPWIVPVATWGGLMTAAALSPVPRWMDPGERPV
jgi:hypothetical protein